MIKKTGLETKNDTSTSDTVTIEVIKQNMFETPVEEITTPKIISGNSKHTQYLSLIKRNHLIIFSYNSMNTMVLEKRKRGKKHFYGLLLMVDLNKYTQKDRKFFLTTADSFSNRIERSETLIETLYLFDLSGETTEYFKRLEQLTEGYKDMIRKKNIRDTVLNYTSENYDYIKFYLDTILGEAYFSGIRIGELSLEEEVLFQRRQGFVLK